MVVHAVVPLCRLWDAQPKGVIQETDGLRWHEVRECCQNTELCAARRPREQPPLARIRSIRAEFVLFRHYIRQPFNVGRRPTQSRDRSTNI